MDEIEYLIKVSEYINCRLILLVNKIKKRKIDIELINKLNDYLILIKKELELWQLKKEKKSFLKLKKN